MASGQFGHHALGFHSAGQHVPVVAVSGYDLIALLQGHLHADDDGFLADIEMAEAADRTHAVELAGLFLEAADQQHVAQRASSCSLVNSGGEPFAFSCPVSFVRRFSSVRPWQFRMRETISPLYPNSNRRERIA